MTLATLGFMNMGMRETARVAPLAPNEEVVDKLVAQGAALGAPQSDEELLELYKSAIEMCPEEPEAYWRIIAELHSKKKDSEAFDYYLRMPNKAMAPIDIPDFLPPTIGMLISVGENETAYDYLIVLINSASEENSFFAKTYLTWVASRLTLPYAKKLIALIAEGVINGHVRLATGRTWIDTCKEELAVKAKLLSNEGKTSEALELLEYVLTSEVKQFQRVSIDWCLELKEILEEEKRMWGKWAELASDSDRRKFLFRKLARRFHPDLATDTDERTMRSEMMSKINRIYANSKLQELEDLAIELVPEWSKHLR